MRKEFLEFLAEGGVLSDDRLDWVDKAWRPPAEPIGSIAFSHGVLSGGDVDRILERQRDSDQPFGQIALELSVLDESQLERLLEIQQMRTAIETAEAIVLAGICPLGEVMGKLGQFLAGRYEAVAEPK